MFARRAQTCVHMQGIDGTTAADKCEDVCASVVQGKTSVENEGGNVFGLWCFGSRMGE